VLYFKLAVWPHPLVFIHDTNVIRQATEALPYALVLAGLLAGTAMALWRWPVAGFAGAWALVILGPTSSIIPLAAQPMAEHRMYLSLAAVIALGVLGLYAWIGRRSLAVFAAAALGLGWLGIQRNQDYQSRLAIWSDTVEKNPDNASARYGLGNAMAQIPDLRSAAVSQYVAALRIKPDYREARINLAVTLSKIPDRLPEAIAQYEKVLQTNPNDLQAHNNLGGIFLGIPGRTSDAIAQYEATLRIKPDYAEAHFNLGIALLHIPGRRPEAIAHLNTALRLRPDFEQAQQLLDAIQKTHSNDNDHRTN
jgi:tetratricopeptide (TPR) repeat protein